MKLSLFVPGPWLVVVLLWFVACLNYLDRIMLMTMRQSVMEVIPMSEKQFGLLSSVFLWVYGLLSPFAGFLADRFSRSRVIIVSLFAWSAITWWTGQARTFEELLVARAFMGISEACYIPAALALIADYHTGPTQSRATGIHMSGIMIGSGLGGLGGWLAERHGWSFAFNLFGIGGIIYAIALFLLLRDRQQPADNATKIRTASAHPEFLRALLDLMKRPPFRLALGFWGLIGLATWAINGWMPTYLKEHFQLSQGAAGLSATGYLQAASVIGVLAGGMWADHWSRTHVRGRIFVPVIGLCLAAPGVLLAAQANLLWLAIAGLMLYGATRAFSDANMMPILCLVADARYRATGYGVLNCFSCIVGGLAIYAGGMLRDASVNVSRIFQFAAVSLLICAVLLFLVKPPQSDQNQTA